MVATIIPVEPFDLVIFGASGDLAKRKIFPSLFRRLLVGQAPPESRIIGASRSALSQEEFHEIVVVAIKNVVSEDEYTPHQLSAFLAMITFISLDAQSEQGWEALEEILRKGQEIRAFYLSVKPDLIALFLGKMGNYQLITPETRVIVEKPLGHDYASAKKLNTHLCNYLDEKKIYRIDHYLGKETVQNLMALRFANTLYEPIWNSHYIDHVQITVSESVDIQGRQDYYDQAGAMRDMVQNHLMQLLCLVAMEVPPTFAADAVRNEKLKVIHSLKSVDLAQTVRGQYGKDQAGQSYLDHVENPASQTESYVALKVEIANHRWANVPFYLRTGKNLRAKVSEIVVNFKSLPHNIFSKVSHIPANRLVMRLQPNEGITQQMMVKDPGPGGMRLKEVAMDMTFADQDFGEGTADAYERLIMDAIRGNQTLFMRGDEVEAAWQWTDHLIKQWQDNGVAPVQYDVGSSGPEAAIALLARDNRQWQDLVGHD